MIVTPVMEIPVRAKDQQEDPMDRENRPVGADPEGDRPASVFDETLVKGDGGAAENLRDRADGSEDVIIDGRVFREGDKVFDLVDVIEDSRGPAPATLPEAELGEAVIREIRDVAERVARELIPDIAERIIREEIEKLKRAEG